MRQRQKCSVTTLRVVWIEIIIKVAAFLIALVTTLRVVWIEIFDISEAMRNRFCHHLAGGVD